MITPEQAMMAIALGVKMLANELREYYARNAKRAVMPLDTQMMLDMIERQQQIIEYLLERENERQGDGK